MTAFKTIGLLSSAVAFSTVVWNVQPARATEPEPFELSVLTPTSLSAGAAGAVVITVTARSGYKVNQEYPYRARVTATGSVSVAKSELRQGDFHFDKMLARASVGLRSSGGRGTIKVELSFSVCSPTRCVVDRRVFERTIE